MHSTKKGAPWAIPTICLLTIKKDELLHPLCTKSRIVVLSNHEDRVWRKSNKFASVLCQDSHRFLMIRAIVRTPSVKAFSLQTRLPSSALLVATRRPLLMNIGSSSRLSAGSNAVHGFGSIRSMQSSGHSASHHLSMILASILDSSATHLIPRPHLPWHHCLSDYMPTTSSIFPKIRQLKPSSATFSESATGWILWGLSSGFLASIFHGASLLPL